MLARLLDKLIASKLALFSVSGLKDEELIKKSKPTWKLKYANTILESFEYFSQMSSKSILIILSHIPFQNWYIFEREYSCSGNGAR